MSTHWTFRRDVPFEQQTAVAVTMGHLRAQAIIEAKARFGSEMARIAASHYRALLAAFCERVEGQ